MCIRDRFNAGFKIKHIGEVLYASVKNEFDAVVDKCEVVIYTDPAECTRVRHEVAIPIFDKRDERLDTLKMCIRDRNTFLLTQQDFAVKVRLKKRLSVTA